MSIRRIVLTALLGFGACAPSGDSVEVFDPEVVAAEPMSAEQTSVLRVAEAALVAISNEDMVAFTDLMFEEAVIAPTGGGSYSISSWESERARTLRGDIVERGFDASVEISGEIASVWLPYDLYIDGEWSHCGVDTFTMVKDDEQWRILTMAWSRLQPPACSAHPDGPPA